MYIAQGEDVIELDVNGLYPSQMRLLMPTAFPKYDTPQNDEYYIKFFEGDISLINQETLALGYFYVEVTCPDHIKHPTLPKRFDTGHGMRTIYPTGTRNDWYFSEELKNTLSLGYTYKVIKGYLFNPQKIFTNYVEDLFKCVAIDQNFRKMTLWSASQK
jgi:DNA polymerase type B, organellar and viral